MNRRKVLLGLAAGTAGTTGLAFGSGAFTTTTADRDLEVGLADSDEDSQLVIEENNELESAAITDDDGEFKIDASGIAPGAITTFGRFTEIDDAGTLEAGVFVIRNENETGEDIDITVEIHDLDLSDDSEIKLALLPDDSVNDSNVESEESGSEGGSVEVDMDGVPSTENDGTDEDEASVEVGFIVDADSDEGDELDGDLTIDAELSGD